MTPFTRRLGACLLIGCCLCFATPAAAATVPYVRTVPNDIVASDMFMWAMSVWLHNPMEVGCYVDSVTCTIVDTSPGVTKVERVIRLDLGKAPKIVPSISAGDSGHFRMNIPALAEEG